MSDIVERLREMERVQSQWDCRPEPRWKEAADEIERLRALITAWADAEDAAWGTESGRLEEACDALRKVVGR